MFVSYVDVENKNFINLKNYVNEILQIIQNRNIFVLAVALL